LGRKRVFGDETKGTSGLKISKKNENRLAAIFNPFVRWLLEPSG
jgi:hypothetical protein